MNKLLALVGICLFLIGTALLPVVAQEDSADSQNDDIEIYVSAGAFIGLQGDDDEIYANGSNISASPLSVMQGDDREIFVEQYIPSNQAVSIASSEDTVETVVEVNLSETLPSANLSVLDNISDEVGTGLPNTRLNNWQDTPVDNNFLMFGGGMALILILAASLLILSGTLKVDSP